MDAIETVNAAFGNVPYMLGCQAVLLRNMIVSNGLRSALELGCAHGKGTCYLAAIMEERGGPGQVTTLDKTSCLSQEPNVHQMLAALNLAHRVSVILEPRSFTMSLLEMLEHPSRPKFDLCFFDGGHSWDETGYAFLLIDKLLNSGRMGHIRRPGLDDGRRAVCRKRDASRRRKADASGAKGVGDTGPRRQLYQSTGDSIRLGNCPKALVGVPIK